jgi:hypothetical protein
MIMKSKLLLYLGAIMVLAGCSKIKDATSVTVNTELNNNIPVTVTASAKSATAAFAINFSETQDLSLADNPDLESRLSKIHEIDLSNLVITITGLGADQTINSLSLDVDGVGNVLLQTNITMTNNSFTPTVSTAILDQMGAKLQADKKLTFTVSGNVSGPMTFVVSCSMDAKVIVYTI